MVVKMKADAFYSTKTSVFPFVLHNKDLHFYDCGTRENTWQFEMQDLCLELDDFYNWDVLKLVQCWGLAVGFRSFASYIMEIHLLWR